MKVVSKDILHKSDAGGVKLNLVGEAGCARPGHRFWRAAIHCRRRHSRCAADTDGEEGVEVIVGVVRDPIFGPVLMFGLGGIFVEILEDVAFRAIPCPARRRDHGRSARARKVLAGVRGEAGGG